MQHRSRPLLPRALAPGVVFACLAIAFITSLPSEGAEPQLTKPFKNYMQWQEALDRAEATAVGSIRAPEGYRISLIRSAGRGEGSWISIDFDANGRILLGREDNGVLRLTLARDRQSIARVEAVDKVLAECRGVLAVDKKTLLVSANGSLGLFQLSDTNGDGVFDQSVRLKRIPGNQGHGRENLTLGPDGKVYLALGNDCRLPDDYIDDDSPLQHYAEDRLVPCRWDAGLMNYEVHPPAGHIVRTDANGKTWQVFAGGLRNSYCVDFNEEGEMFTFDADMEWDLGAPWYKPTRILHLVSGGDYGWRRGTRNWRDWYPDSVPTTLDIGLASPTTIKFGTNSNFPPKYRKALFALDWAYGRILAIHLDDHGAGYRGHGEIFVKGRPLNVTGMEFGPDGGLYFITGGRGTQSGLYRLDYVGPRVAEAPPTAEQAASHKKSIELRALRRKLEAMHNSRDPEVVDNAWEHLDHEDELIRHAARVAIELQPLKLWRDRAMQERIPTKALVALLALSRAGIDLDREKIIARLSKASLAGQSKLNQLIALRTLIICGSRLGHVDSDDWRAVLAKIDPLYPSGDGQVNQLLCELLVAIGAPNLPERTLPLVHAAPTQEEKMFYLFELRVCAAGWTDATRQAYFTWLQEGERTFQGAHEMPGFLASIREDAVAHLKPDERKLYARFLVAQTPVDSDAPSVAEAAPRAIVKHWQSADLAPLLGGLRASRNLTNGAKMFDVAQCSRCHKSGAHGSQVGPDLTSVASRFGPRDLVEHIVNPSKAIDDKYRAISLSLDDGRTITGTIAIEDAASVQIVVDPLQPAQRTTIAKANITARRPSTISTMPAGLLDTLQAEEILDLLAYLAAGK